MQARASDPLTWRVFGVLMAGALLGLIGILPYVLTLLDRLPPSVADSLPPLWVLLPLQLAQSLVLIGLATALGLWLGPKFGFGAPQSTPSYAATGKSPHLRALFLPSAVLGVLVGVAIVLLDLWVFAPRLAASGSPSAPSSHRPGKGYWPRSMAASSRELLLRLGLMTLLVWIGVRLTRSAVAGPVVAWAAIVTAALLFGAGHLSDDCDPGAVDAASGDGPCAAPERDRWARLRLAVLEDRGLLAAMLAHFSADIVLHVVWHLR